MVKLHCALRVLDLTLLPLPQEGILPASAADLLNFHGPSLLKSDVKRVKGVKYVVTEGDGALGGEHTRQYTAMS